MNYISIDSVGADTLDRVNKILAGIPGGAIKAAQQALKRAGDTAKTRAGQFAAAEYTINKGTFMANVSMKTEAGGAGGSAAQLRISFAGSPLPLLTFNTRYSRSGRVTAQVLRNSGGGILGDAFVARIGGRLGVYERIGSSRFPVEGKYGPGTSKMMGNEDVVEKMDKTISETFEKRIEVEIRRILAGG